MPKKKKKIEFDSPHSGDRLILTEDETGKLVHNWERGKKKSDNDDDNDEHETLLDRIISNFSKQDDDDDDRNDSDDKE